MRASAKSDLTACYPLVSAILFWFRERDECHASTKTGFFLGFLVNVARKIKDFGVLTSSRGGGGE